MAVPQRQAEPQRLHLMFALPHEEQRWVTMPFVPLEHGAFQLMCCDLWHG